MWLTLAPRLSIHALLGLRASRRAHAPRAAAVAGDSDAATAAAAAAELDRPNRLRVALVILRASGHYFAAGPARARLERLLIALQRAALAAAPLPIDLAAEVSALLDRLSPRGPRCASLPAQTSSQLLGHLSPCGPHFVPLHIVGHFAASSVVLFQYASLRAHRLAHAVRLSACVLPVAGSQVLPRSLS